MKHWNNEGYVPDVSVVLCTYNRADMLTRTLRSLIRQEVDEISFEIIIVDDGSTDNTSEVVEAARKESPVPIRYFCQPNLGVGHARNRAASEALGSWIAMIDDDELAPRKWLHELVNTARDTGADCVGGFCRLKVIGTCDIRPIGTVRMLLGENPAMKGNAPKQSLYDRLRFRATRVAVPGGGNALIKKQVIEKLGRFRPMRGGEDLDFFRRAEMDGARFACASRAVIYHLIPSDRLAPGRLYGLAKNAGATQAKFDGMYSRGGRQHAVALLRLSHLGVITAPALLLHAARSERSQIVSRLCSLHFATSYIRSTLQASRYWGPSASNERVGDASA